MQIFNSMQYGFDLIEMEKLRQLAVTDIRSNQQLEADLNQMDIKIGLLVKNRITIQVSTLFVLPKLSVKPLASECLGYLISSIMFFKV